MSLTIGVFSVEYDHLLLGSTAGLGTSEHLLCLLIPLKEVSLLSVSSPHPHPHPRKDFTAYVANAGLLWKRSLLVTIGIASGGGATDHITRVNIRVSSDPFVFLKAAEKQYALSKG